MKAENTSDDPLPIRRCRHDERDTILSIINEAALRYRGVIPADCWHEPYMSAADLEREFEGGVTFSGIESPDGDLIAVMGVQEVKDVTLIRHAYVRREHQGKGIGGRLLKELESRANRRMLIGTWADATWAIRFYEAYGYALIPPSDTAATLDKYWKIPVRQRDVSVVLAKDP